MLYHFYDRGFTTTYPTQFVNERLGRVNQEETFWLAGDQVLKVSSKCFSKVSISYNFCVNKYKINSQTLIKKNLPGSVAARSRDIEILFIMFIWLFI